jgi:hypothetical protein
MGRGVLVLGLAVGGVLRVRRPAAGAADGPLLWVARDLLRDPRILVHSVITSRDDAEGEFKIRGTARAEDDPAVQRRYADAVAASLGWNPQPGRFHLFAVDIGQLTVISYDTATSDQHVATWPPAREFIRRATSPTSVGDPEPINDIIQAG